MNKKELQSLKEIGGLIQQKKEKEKEKEKRKGK